MDDDVAPGGGRRSATAPPRLPRQRSDAPARRPTGEPARSRWDIAWLGGRSSAPWVVLAAALVLLVALAGTAYVYLRPDALGWGTRTYSSPTAHEAVLTFDLTKQPTAAASCDVLATDRGDQPVGRVDGITFPATPGGPHTVTRTVTVPTTSRAAGVGVDTCRITSTG